MIPNYASGKQMLYAQSIVNPKNMRAAIAKHNPTIATKACIVARVKTNKKIYTHSGSNMNRYPLEKINKALVFYLPF